MALQPEKTARDISRRRQYFYRKMTSFLISGVISRGNQWWCHEMSAV